MACVRTDTCVQSTCGCKEYTILVDRVNDNLRTLKADLISMRRQDVKLLKQLVNINDVIQAMNQKWKEFKQDGDDYDDDNDGTVNTSKAEIFEVRRRAPLIRQQSVPSYYSHHSNCIRNSFDSSIDDLGEITEDEESCGTNEDTDRDSLFSVNGCITGSQNYRLRQRAISCEVTSTDSGQLDDSHFEDMLMKNIRLWKHYSTKNSNSQNISPTNSENGRFTKRVKNE